MGNQCVIKFFTFFQELIVVESHKMLLGVGNKNINLVYLMVMKLTTCVTK